MALDPGFQPLYLQYLKNLLLQFVVANEHLQWSLEDIGALATHLSQHALTPLTDQFIYVPNWNERALALEPEEPPTVPASPGKPRDNVVVPFRSPPRTRL